MARLDMRFKSVGEVLDTAWELFAARPRLFIGIALAVFAPIHAAFAIATMQLRQRFDDALLQVYRRPYILINLLITAGAAAMAVEILSILPRALVIRAAGDAYLGRRTGLGTVVRATAPRALALLAAGILMLTAFYLGLVALFVPGILAYLAFALCLPAIVLDGFGPIDSFYESARLTRGYRGTLYLILTCYVLFEFLLGLAATVQFVPGLAWLGVVVQTCVGSACAMGTSILISVIYYNAKCRNDGFDIELMIARLDKKAAQA
jgi:hypothetical protein